MRVDTSQEHSFADGLIQIPDTELDRLAALIDWEKLSGYLDKVEGDYPGLCLFKILLLQTWFSMSDQSVSDALQRDLVFMRFCGLSVDGNKPTASTICRFRQRLIESCQLSLLLTQLNDQLARRGLKLANGKYVSCDATLISSARRPRKRLKAESAEGSHESKYYEVKRIEYSDDHDASWKNKGTQSVYGYAGFLSTDENGFVEAVTTRTARDSEVRYFPEVMEQSNIRPGKTVLYDKGADSAANRKALDGLGLRDGVMRKKPQGKPMSYWHRLRNRLIAKRRFVTERTFGTLKRTYGLHRARYLGLEKVNAEILIKSIAYNLKRGLGVLRQMNHAHRGNCV